MYALTCSHDGYVCKYDELRYEDRYLHRNLPPIWKHCLPLRLFLAAAEDNCDRSLMMIETSADRVEP
jgi:hypothetical protein